jgi:hypothetical protein
VVGSYLTDAAAPRASARLLPGQLLMESMVAAISDEGVVTVSEAELLRCACIGLRCPLPPLLRRR